MGLPRPWFILLLLLCAIAIVAHQSAAPVTHFFSQSGGGGRKVVTLADLGTSLKPPRSSAADLGGSEEGQSWQEALGGLFGAGSNQADFQGDKREVFNKGDGTLKMAVDRLGDVSSGEAEVSDGVAELSGDDEVVVDWGLLTDQTEDHSDPKSGASGVTELESLVNQESGLAAGGKRTTDSGGLGESTKRAGAVLKQPVDRPITGAHGTVIQKPPKPPQGSTCREWMTDEWERWEAGFRDFREQPVRISDAGARSWFETTREELQGCDIGCEMHAAGSLDAPDGTTEHWVGEVQPGLPSSGLVTLRNVESFTNYPSIANPQARTAGVDILSNFRLDSDVPHVYFSWSGCVFNLRGNDCNGLEIMGPVHKKTAKAAAAAFISNCDAKNFRTAAVKGLIENGIAVSNFGDCVHTADLPGGDVKGYDESKYGSKYHNKLVQFQTHKFALAFENSCEDDYVTEKFFHALAAGSVPVVVGAPNTAHFAPAPNSYLQIASEGEIPVVAEKMRYLMENETAYAEMLAWKTAGPSDAFKALMDLQAVHPTCRLCQHVAYRLREREEAAWRQTHAPPPCYCQETTEKGEKRSSYTLLVRERGLSRFRPLVLDALALRGLANLEAAVLEEFKRLGHEPVWMKTRAAAGVKTTSWRVYKLYPIGLTQKQALFGGRVWESDADLLNYLSRNPCPKFEVVFV